MIVVAARIVRQEVVAGSRGSWIASLAAGNRPALQDMAAVVQRSFLARGLNLQGMVLKERVGLVRR